MAKEGGNKKPKKLTIILIIASILVALGVVAVVFITSGGKLSEVAAKFETEQEYVVKMEDFVVNLSPAGQTNSYLKTQISLVYTDKKKGKIITEKSSQIRDVIIKDLMGYSADELLKSGGLESVKGKLKSDINKTLDGEVVTGIYFANFLIQ